MTKENKIKKIKKNIEENKPIMTIGKVLYIILFIFTILILLVVLMQRFSNNTLAIGGYRMFNIISESMVPKYEIGDIILSKSIEPKDIKVGDDITYMGESGAFEGRIVTHQVISIEQEDGKYIFHTKGIANDIADPEVKENQIYGKIVHKFVTLSFIGKITNNMYGFYILIFIPISILIALKIREIIKNANEEDSEEDRKKRIEELKREKEKGKNGRKK